MNCLLKMQCLDSTQVNKLMFLAISCRDVIYLSEIGVVSRIMAFEQSVQICWILLLSNLNISGSSCCISPDLVVNLGNKYPCGRVMLHRGIIGLLSSLHHRTKEPRKNHKKKKKKKKSKILKLVVVFFFLPK